MANVIALNVYQINDNPVRQGSSLYVSIDFPTKDIFARETDITVSGVQMNSFIILGSNQYYVEETVAEIETAANAGGGGGGVESVDEIDGSVVVDNTDPANPLVGLPYKVYTALLSQSGTDAPVPTVLENTLGVTPAWGYGNVGNYELSGGGFNITKTAIFITPGNGVFNGNIYRVSADIEAGTIYLLTQGNDGQARDDWGAPLSIKIEVYP